MAREAARGPGSGPWTPRSAGHPAGGPARRTPAPPPPAPGSPPARRACSATVQGSPPSCGTQV
eukprot:10738694-Alexandrium_andersonii.AAC.1